MTDASGAGPREVWVTRDECSVDKDRLTHIALHQCYPEHNPMRFIERKAYDAVCKERDEWKQKCIKAWEEIEEHDLRSDDP